MQTVRTKATVSVKPSGRVAVARRVQAARLMAGDPSLRRLARDGGLSYQHLVAVVNAQHPLTDTDATTLGELLGVPASWLRHGWTDTTYSAS